MKILELHQVEYSYRNVPVLNGISFFLNKGEILGLIGPNGAGKSTTISICATLLKPSKGWISFYGKKVEDYKEIRSKLGLVPQEIALYNNMTTKENLDFFGKLCGIKHKDLSTRVKAVGDMVEVSLEDKKKIKELSGGMKRRINIAVALLNNPELIIMDEPTVGIDIQSRQYILKTVKNLKNQGTSIIYTTHYIDEIYNLCNRIIAINNGIIVGNKINNPNNNISFNRDKEDEIINLMG